MALKINNLEHLDGKGVRYSTITSQHPDIFINRKRNTGELIITTDTDPKYGMHHIYAGGEHIAGGYGFALGSTRDDLCYIQETYNSTFEYFDNAYAYLLDAYSFTYNYAYSAALNLYKTIFEHSYTNTCVDEDNNKIILGDTTYLFTFDKGTLSVNKNLKGKIVLNNENNVIALNKLNQKQNINQEYHGCQTTLSIINSTGTEYLPFSQSSIQDLNINVNYSTDQSIETDIKHMDGLPPHIINNAESIRELLLIGKQENDVIIPVPLNNDISVSISYILSTKKIVNDNENNNEEIIISGNNIYTQSNILSINWCYPILYGKSTTLFDKVDNSLDINDFVLKYKTINELIYNYNYLTSNDTNVYIQNYKNNKEKIVVSNINMAITNKKIEQKDDLIPYFIWLLIPNDLLNRRPNLSTVEFYYNDNNKTILNEGGFYLDNTLLEKNNPNSDLTKVYSLFISDMFFTSQNINLNIVFNY